MNIKTKFLVISTSLLLISNSVIGFMGYHKAASELDNLGRTSLKNATKEAIVHMESLNNQVKAGTITLKEAKEEAATSIFGTKNADGTRTIKKDVDLGKEGYLYVISPKGELLIHPKQEGENIYNTKDSDGDLVGKMVVENATKDGFSKYNWELPNGGGVASKIVYSQEFKDWGWIVAAGSYEKDFNAGAKNILDTTLIVTVISVLIGFAVIYYSTNSIARTLNLVKRRLEKVAEGDLNGEKLIVESKDETRELAKSLNKMSTSLKDLLSSVGQSAQELNSSSEETASAIEEITAASERINEIIQTVALEAQNGQGATIKAVKSLEELNNLIQEVKARTLKGNEMSSQTMTAAQKGAKKVEGLVSRMSQIENKTVQTQEVIKELEKYSHEISDITNTITDIAGQTNLLALNAAIEAARAGEHGKGFSVVADEVRKLSEQSNEGANQVAALTQKISELTKKSSIAMEESRGIVEEGVASARVAGQSLEDILLAVQNTVNEIHSIKNLTEDGADSSNKILELIQYLAESSEKIAASSQEASASAEENTASIQTVSAISEETSGMANELNVSVEKFKF